MSTPPRRPPTGSPGAPPRIRRRRRRPPRRDDESKESKEDDETKEDRDPRTFKAKLDDEAVVDARENPDQKGNDKSVQPLLVTPSLLLF